MGCFMTAIYLHLLFFFSVSLCITKFSESNSNKTAKKQMDNTDVLYPLLIRQRIVTYYSTTERTVDVL